MTAPLDRVKALLAALPPEDQAELKRYLADILMTPEEAESIQVASLETKRRGGGTVTYTFRQEHVRCGKPACWCSESGLGHGPYTYKYWKEDGKLRKEYVGVSHPDAPKRAPRARRRRARSNTQPAPT